MSINNTNWTLGLDVTKETWSCFRLSPLERAVPEQRCPRATEGNRSCPELTHSCRKVVLHVLNLLFEAWMQHSWKGFQASRAVLQEFKLRPQCSQGCASRGEQAGGSSDLGIGRGAPWIPTEIPQCCTKISFRRRVSLESGVEFVGNAHS